MATKAKTSTIVANAAKPIATATKVKKTTKRTKVANSSRLVVTFNLYLEPGTEIPGPRLLGDVIQDALLLDVERDLGSMKVGKVQISKPVDYRIR